MKHILQSLIAVLLLPAFAHSQATLISQFDFSGNFADAQGNGTLVGYANVSANLSSTAYSWVGDSLSNGGGLLMSIPDAIFTEDNYSIAIDFSYQQVNGYRKIIDFDRLGSDQGLYVNSSLRIYSAGNFGSTLFNANQNYTVVLTRNGVNDSAHAYLLLNGNTLNLESAAQDASNIYVADSVSGYRVFHLFHDDTLTNVEFSTRGTVNQIRVWNGIVSLADVAVGISEAASTSASLYPNPTTDFTRITFNEPTTGVMQIISTTGQVVNALQLNNALVAELNTESLPASIYFIQVNDLRMKFVKQ